MALGMSFDHLSSVMRERKINANVDGSVTCRKYFLIALFVVKYGEGRDVSFGGGEKVEIVALM